MRIRSFSLVVLGVLLFAVPTSASMPVMPDRPSGPAPARALAVDPVDGHVVGQVVSPAVGASTAVPGAPAAPSGSASRSPGLTAALTIDPVARYEPRATTLGGRGGATGALHSMETVDGAARRYEWITVDGQATDLGPADSVSTVAGEDVIAVPGGPEGDPSEWVDLKDIQTQEGQRIPLGGRFYLKTLGRTVVVGDGADASDLSSLHLLRIADGTLRDLAVPPTPCALDQLGDGDPTSVMAFCTDGTVGLIDLGTGAFTGVSQKLGPGEVTTSRLTSTHLIWTTLTDGIAAAPRSGGAASRVTVTNPGDHPLLGMSGQWFVAGHGYNSLPLEPFGDLQAVPVGGGAAVKLIDWPHWLAQLSDGTLLTIAGLPGSQGLYRIAPGGDGAPTVTLVRAVIPADAAVMGIALAGRRLATVDSSTAGNWVGDRSLGLSGPFTAGPRRTLANGPFLENCFGPCVPLKASGGATVYSGNLEYIVVDARGRHRRIPMPSQQDSLSTTLALSDSYFGFYSTGFPPASRLFDLSTGRAIAAPSVAWTLWGDELWALAADFGTTGRVTRTNLRTGATSSITTGSTCHPNAVRLQVVGRWLNWRCTTSSQEVIDTITGRRVPLAAVQGVLGDGYFVYHDEAGLWRINLTSDVPDTVLLAKPDQDGLLPEVGVRWAVDSHGGQCVAWTDTAHRIHLEPVGVPASPLTLATADAPARFTDVWQPTWTLSKPAHWTLVMRSEGTTVATLSGSSYGVAVTPDWAGVTASAQGMGPIRGTGRFQWELTLTPADGVGPSMVLDGEVTKSRDRLPPPRFPETL